jgi:hypothetical protein
MAKKDQAVKEGELVAMVRDAEQFPAPHSADVHPDEVENYKVGGWTVKE